MIAKIVAVSLFFLFLASVVFAAPWDPLRAPAAAIGIIEPVIVWVLLLVSLGIFAISALAWKKKKSSKLAWVSAAFALFFIKSLLVVLDLYVSSGNFFNYSIQSFFDLLIIAGLFVAIFRK